MSGLEEADHFPAVVQAARVNAEPPECYWRQYGIGSRRPRNWLTKTTYAPGASMAGACAVAKEFSKGLPTVTSWPVLTNSIWPAIVQLFASLDRA